MNDIDEILEQGIMQLFPKISVNFPGITRRIIKTESQQCLISAGTAQYEDIKKFLGQRGEILAQYDSSFMVAARIKGGFLSMNPALVLCSLCDDQLWISTYAKEGLIKQRTAEKLLDRLCAEFKQEYGNLQITGTTT